MKCKECEKRLEKSQNWAKFCNRFLKYMIVVFLLNISNQVFEWGLPSWKMILLSVIIFIIVDYLNPNKKKKQGGRNE